MKKLILCIDGVTSFTGFHFAKMLSKKFYVYAFVKKKKKAYKYIKKKRLGILEKIKNIRLIYNCTTGSSIHLKKILLIKKIDIYCFHAAHVNNYKSTKFSFFNAYKKNTHNLEKILKILKTKKTKICFSHSIFQSIPRNINKPIASNYALSKDITYLTLLYLVRKFDLRLFNLVITNPFGALEDKKFPFYLMTSWLKKKIPFIEYTKQKLDFIPIDILGEVFLKKLLIFLKDKKKIIFYIPSFYKVNTLQFAKILKKKLLLYSDINLHKNELKTLIIKKNNLKNYVNLCGNEKVRFKKKIEKKFWPKYINYYHEITKTQKQFNTN